MDKKDPPEFLESIHGLIEEMLVNVEALKQAIKMQVHSIELINIELEDLRNRVRKIERTKVKK